MKITLQLLGMLLVVQQAIAQVGINTESPSAASALEVSSTSDGITHGGFLPPRVTPAELATIPVTAADDGLLVYVVDGTRRCLTIFDGVDMEWHEVYCPPLNQVPMAYSVNLPLPLGKSRINDGDVLNVTYSYSDTESDLEGTPNISWIRSDGTVLSTATSYTVQPTDIGYSIRYEIQPTALTGASPGVFVSSNSRIVYANEAPTAASVSFYLPTNLNIGTVITGNYTYQDNDGDTEATVPGNLSWYRSNNSSMTGAVLIGTGSTYTLTNADHNMYLQYRVQPIAATGVTNGLITSSTPRLVQLNQAPTASNVDINADGCITPNFRLRVSYNYSDVDGDPEYDSVKRFYRSTTATGTGTLISSSTVINAFYTVSTADIGYYVYATIEPRTYSGVNSAAQYESSRRQLVQALGDCELWVNEFHYDDTGADSNEGIEVAGTAGTNLGSYALYREQQNSTVMSPLTMIGTLPNQQNNVGTRSFTTTLSDTRSGIAVVRLSDYAVIDYISWEGTDSYSNSSGNYQSVNCGQTESGATFGGTSNTSSIQRFGTGNQGTDFTWTSATRSPNLINTGQTIN